MENHQTVHACGFWNKVKFVGQKALLKIKDIWVSRVKLQLSKLVRELAQFNLALDSKLHGCDLVGLRVKDVSDLGSPVLLSAHS